MADMDPLANSQQQGTSTTPQTAGNAAQPSEQMLPSAEGVVPLFDIIEACLEEFPALREVMPSRLATTCVMSDDGEVYSVCSTDSKARIDSCLDRLTRKEHAVLIVEDVDASCFQVLVARFPASLDAKFLAQHVLRLGGLKTTYGTHDGLGDEYRALVARVDAELSRRLSRTAARQDCCHLDGHIYRSMLSNLGSSVLDLEIVSAEDGYRTEQRIV